MKLLFLSTLLLWMIHPLSAQTIIEALQLKQDSIGEYADGELRATDTIVDIQNGYYEAYSSFGDERKTIIRQAAIFHNEDGTRTLGIAVAEYDFVCIYTTTSFFIIPKSKNRIDSLQAREILPPLNIREFLEGTNVLPVLFKYLPENTTDTTATIDQALTELYHIVYRLPRYGTSIIASLEVCDYGPAGFNNISPEDWAILKKDFLSITLVYDKTRMRFLKRLVESERE